MSSLVQRLFGAARRDRRKAARIRNLLNKVEIDRHVFQVEDWSCDGFLIRPYGGALTPEQRFYARFWLHTERKGRVDLPVRCRVVRVEREGLAAQFIEISAQCREMLERESLRQLRYQDS